MTAQTREILYYKGKIYHLATEPLKQLLELMVDEKLAFVANSTAYRRGYVGIWEIVDDKLFLTDLKGRTKDIMDATQSKDT
jgi:hypothetical protein